MPYGLILDVDGVLADTEALLARATIAMFRELYDVEFAPEDFEPYVGAGSKRYTLGPAHMRGLEIDLETALSKRRENFLALLQSAESIAFPGAAELIEVAYDHPEWRLAVATSSRSDRAGATLAAAAFAPSPHRRQTMNPLDAVSTLGHAESLGRLEDLPPDYLKAINDLSVAPLWPQLRGLLPRGPFTRSLNLIARRQARCR